MPCTLADFRIQAPFSVFWTEVSCLVPFLTSVSKVCFLCFGRKYRALRPSRLPYRESFSLVFGIFLEFTMPGHYYFQECSCGSVTRRDCSLEFRDQCICIHCFLTRQDSNSEFREQRICIQLAIRLQHSSCHTRPFTLRCRTRLFAFRFLRSGCCTLVSNLGCSTLVAEPGCSRSGCCIQVTALWLQHLGVKLRCRTRLFAFRFLHLGYCAQVPNLGYCTLVAALRC